MRKLLAMVVLVVAVGGCKDKKAPPKADPAGAGSAAVGAGGAGTGTAGPGDGTRSATTAASGDLKPVTECPAALKDADQGLARTIPAGCTTVVEGEYLVDGTLTLEAGATLKFKPDATLGVGYTDASKLLVRGTKDQPVTFTSAGDQVPGAWKGVRLYAKAARSEIAGLVLEHATVGLEVDSAELTVKDSVFRATKELAVRVTDDVVLAGFAGNTFDQVGAVAMSVPPAALVGIGANTFGADTAIEVRAGNATASGTWANPGAPLRVSGEVYLDGKSGKITVEVAAGNRLRFDAGGALLIGYTGDAELKVTGTKDAPVTFGSAGDQQPGAWDRGVTSYSKGTITVDHALFAHGGRDDAGALRAEGGRLAVTNTRFTDNKVGLSLDDASELRGFDSNQLGGNQVAALLVFPRHLGALGAASTYAATQKIGVRGGRVDKTATWALQAGAEVVVDGEINVEGGATLTVPAGASYRFTEAGALYVGYASPGTLLVQGTAAQPVIMAGVRDGAGAWKGVELYAQAVASVVEHLVVKGAGGGAGVRASSGAVLKVDGLTCGACEAAALTWDCASKVTQTGVKAEGGTPKGAVAPEGC